MWARLFSLRLKTNMKFRVGAYLINQDGKCMKIVRSSDKLIAYKINYVRYNIRIEIVMNSIRSGFTIYSEEALRIELIKELINE